MNDREQYVEQAKSELYKIDTKILQAERSSENPALLGEIKQKREMISNEFEQLQQSSNEFWDEMRTGFEASCRDIERLLERAENMT